jgi:hypothetical protein
MGKLLGSSAAKPQEESNIASISNEGSSPQTLNTPRTNNIDLRNTHNHQPLSSSLVSSVNIAAETARLVLDQSDQKLQLSSLPNVEEQTENGLNDIPYNLEWDRDADTRAVAFSSPAQSNIITKLDASVRSELTENTNEEERRGGYQNNVPGSSPPPLAFQNLPMSRYLPTSSRESKVEGGGVMMGGSRPFEVTNHFDAATAISAALASSHLAQVSSKGMGELQSVKKKGMMAREESFTDDSVDIVLTPSNSTQNKLEKQNNDQMGKVSTVGRKLPSPEEAVREMQARRSSYDDDSFTDFLGNAYNDKITANGQESPESDKGEATGEKSEPSRADESVRRKSNQTEGGDSISICSSNGRSNFENESNTSSYGSSDFSPITMSFGSSSDDGKQEQNNHVAGMLGTLTKPPVAVAAEGDASYEAGTDEEDTSHEGGPEARVAAARPLIDQGSKLSKHLAPSRIPTKDDTPTTRTVASKLPINQQYLALFESFDRNLAQSVIGPDEGRMLELSQKFLSSFVAVLGVVRDKKQKQAKQSNGRSSDIDTGLTHYDWCWEDSHEILGYDLGIVAEEKTVHKDAEVEEHTEEQGKTSVGVPTIVIRSMWKACLFETTDNLHDEEEVERVIDSIQENLVSNLHYLAETEDSPIPCLCLTLPLYKEYAWYLLFCRSTITDSVENIVADWHAKFATFLHEMLLRDKIHDDCKPTKDRLRGIVTLSVYSLSLLTTIFVDHYSQHQLCADMRHTLYQVTRHLEYKAQAKTVNPHWKSITKGIKTLRLM